MLKLIEIATAEVGYRCEAGKSKYFCDLFPNEHHKPWCVPFIESCMKAAYGEENALQLLHMEAFTQSPVALMRYFKTAGEWTTHAAEAEPGDLLIFRTTNEAANHAALVVDTLGDQLTVVSGNIDGAVALETYAADDYHIAGICKTHLKEYEEALDEESRVRNGNDGENPDPAE